MAGAPDSKAVRNIVYAAAIVIVFLAIATMGVRLYLLIDSDTEVEPLPALATAEPGDGNAAAQAALQSAEQARQDANDALDRANETTSTLELLLSFLEGAAVLAGLALGATAYFGFRNSQEMRKELEDEVNEAKQQSKDLQAQLDGKMKEADQHMSDLSRRMQELDGLENRFLRGLERIDGFDAKIIQTQTDVLSISGELIRAQQELNLSNYISAHQTALRILKLDPNNLQALYIAGWLELQYIPGSLDDGVQRLREVLRLQPDWPDAQAALGVGLRRKAKKSSENARRDLFNESNGYLLQALGQNHGLLDLNRESFWGPMAGNARDAGDIERAIAYYEEALKVTPGSSYPWGNLAGLYLEQKRPETTILKTFESTLQSAQMELSFNPRDYYNMMDIAMAATMLGHDDSKQFDYADRMLDTALSLDDVTDEVLCVSLQGGWQRLAAHCPDAWTEVKSRLLAAIAKIRAHLFGPCPGE
jgi:hypothetical protein